MFLHDATDCVSHIAGFETPIGITADVGGTTLIAEPVETPEDVETPGLVVVGQGANAQLGATLPTYEPSGHNLASMVQKMSSLLSV